VKIWVWEQQRAKITEFDQKFIENIFFLFSQNQDCALHCTHWIGGGWINNRIMLDSCMNGWWSTHRHKLDMRRNCENSAHRLMMPCPPHVYGSHLPRPQYSPVRWLKLCWKIWFWIVAEKINTVSAEKTSRLRGKPIVCVLHHRRTCNDAHFPCPKLIGQWRAEQSRLHVVLWCVVCAIVSVAFGWDWNLVFAFIVCDLVLVIKWRGASWDGNW